MPKFVRIGLVVVAVMMAVILVTLLLLPPLPSRFAYLLSKSDMPVKALSNLRALYAGITMYASDHDGTYPPDLEALFQEGGPMQKPPGGEEFLHSPHLHYFAPPPGVNQKTAPLNPETVLLRYDHKGYQAIVTADGSGKVERKPAKSP
ncbi:MAG TPA: hypothetical protein VNQ90_16515 [Chthoniobacteraceae bacterium]|nr:hypothetical protein [Chthoniobacteraceae bacterium]